MTSSSSRQHMDYLPHSTDISSIVLSNLMKGDYYRDLAKIKIGDERKETGRVALKAYQKAVDVAEVGLPVANWMRLGAKLKMSMLLYGVMEWKEMAIQIAEDASREAALEIDKEDSSVKSKIVLELLMGNIDFWKKLCAA